MLSIYTKQLSEALAALRSLSKFDNHIPYIRIEGEYGSGKTVLLESIIKTLKDEKAASLIFHLDKPSISTVTDIPLAILASKKFSDTPYASVKTSESEYIKLKFDDKVVSLSETNQAAVSELLTHARLPAYPEYAYHKSLGKSRAAVESEADAPKIGLLETNLKDVCAEALIIDLINYFYPNLNKEQDLSEFIRKATPKKVIIALDEYYNIAAGVDDFICNNLLPYLNKSFFDFVAYDPVIESKAQVSNLLDIRVISCGRNSIDEVAGDKNSFKHNVIKLGKLNDDILNLLIKSRQLKQPLTLEELAGLSKRNLLAALNIINTLALSANINIEEYYSAVYASITKGMAPYEAEWLTCFAFMPKITDVYLKFFPQTGSELEFILPYSRRSIYMSHLDGGIIALDEDVRFFVRGFLQHNNHPYYLALHNIEIYSNELPGDIFNLSPEDWEILSACAYFERFDKGFAVNSLFEDSAPKALELISRLQKYFVQGTYTISLQEDIRRNILLVIKNGDTGSYYHNVEAINGIWKKQENFLLESEKELELKISSAYSKLDAQKSAKIRAEEELEKAQNDYAHLESLEVKKHEARFEYSSKKQIRPGNLPIMLFILFLALALFSDEVFGKFIDSPGTIDVLHKMMYLFAALSGSYLAWVFIRAALIGEGQKTFDNLTKQAKKAQGEKHERFLAIQNNKIEKERLGIELAETQREILELESKLDIIREKKKEPFI